MRRNFGAIIVAHDEIIATGYTGSPRGRENCLDRGSCVRETLGIPRGTMYERCRSVHAEANAIISASRKDMIGATLYLVGKEKQESGYVADANSCAMCKRFIINAGIETVVIRDTETFYRTLAVQEWVDCDETLGSYEGY